MKQQFNNLLARLSPFIRVLSGRYMLLILFIAFAATYGTLVLRISKFYAAEPSQTQIDNKLQTIQRPRIDQDTLVKIQELHEQNIQVQTLFEQARQNPFVE